MCWVYDYKFGPNWGWPSAVLSQYFNLGLIKILQSQWLQYAASVDWVRWDKCHAWQSQLVFWLSCWKFWNMSLTQLYIPMCSKTQDGSTSKINCQIWFSVVPYPSFVPSKCSYAVTVYVLNLGFLCILQ